MNLQVTALRLLRPLSPTLTLLQQRTHRAVAAFVEGMHFRVSVRGSRDHLRSFVLCCWPVPALSQEGPDHRTGSEQGQSTNTGHIHGLNIAARRVPDYVSVVAGVCKCVDLCLYMDSSLNWGPNQGPLHKGAVLFGGSKEGP